MKELNNTERKTIRAFLKVYIPEYIKEYSDDEIDLMDCYEVGFTFANDLLKNQKIDPRFSPWGNGNSVIFNNHYTQVLQNLLKDNLSKEINEYRQFSIRIYKVDTEKSSFQEVAVNLAFGAIPLTPFSL